jgi:hypothetical protein
MVDSARSLRHGILPALIFGAIAILSLAATASGDLSRWTSLDVSRVLSGEVWRLFSGHLTHLTWRQFAVDASGFLLSYTIYSQWNGIRAGICLLLFSSVCVSLAVVVTGEHQIYGGLSGLNCAAVSALLLSMIQFKPRRIDAYLLGIAFGAYILFGEGEVSGVDIAWEAHLAGGLAGVGFFLIQHWFGYLGARGYKGS